METIARLMNGKHLSPEIYDQISPDLEFLTDIEIEPSWRMKVLESYGTNIEPVRRTIWVELGEGEVSFYRVADFSRGNLSSMIVGSVDYTPEQLRELRQAA